LVGWSSRRLEDEDGEFQGLDVEMEGIFRG